MNTHWKKTIALLAMTVIFLGAGCTKAGTGYDTIPLTESGIGIADVPVTFAHDVKYSLREEEGKKIYYLSSSSIEDRDPNCAAKSGPLGAVVVSATEPQAEGPMAKPDNVVKVGNQYAYYTGPQTTCTTDPEVQLMVDTDKKWIAEGKIVEMKK